MVKWLSGQIHHITGVSIRIYNSKKTTSDSNTIITEVPYKRHIRGSI